MTEVLQAWSDATILAGEAGPLCGPVAMLAVYHVSRRNPKMNGRATPTPAALGVAFVADALPDPTGGARFLFSRQDVQKPAVQALTSDLTLVWEFECTPELGLLGYD